jgi:DNA-binding transcriptional LysR family regulator
LNRTTRSVAATQAGHQLYERLTPLLRDLDSAFNEVDEFNRSPKGTLRINTSLAVASMLIEKAVPVVIEAFPDLSVNLVPDGHLVDIVAERFDAGIRFRESMPQDKTAVPFDGLAALMSWACRLISPRRRRSGCRRTSRGSDASGTACRAASSIARNLPVEARR